MDMLLKYYCFHCNYKELVELLPLFWERIEPFHGLKLGEIGFTHAQEYTEQILRLLLEHTIDLNEQNGNGNSILHEKLKEYRNTYIGVPSIVPPEKNEPDIILDLLLERIDLDVNLMNYNDLPPLYYACSYTTGRIVGKLLGCGADPFVLCGKKGSTLLHVSCESGKMDIIQTLILFDTELMLLTQIV